MRSGDSSECGAAAGHGESTAEDALAGRAGRPPAVAAINPARALEALREATIAFAEADLDSQRALATGLGWLIEVTGASAGGVAIPGEDGVPRLVASRQLQGAAPFSKTVLAAALATDHPRALVTEVPPSPSVCTADIVSVLCAPVRRHGHTLAALYLDRRGLSPPFDETAKDVVTTFSAMLALVLDLSAVAASAMARCRQAEEQAQQALAVAAHVRDWWEFGTIRTRNRRFTECLRIAQRIAKSDLSVLVQGETGTGKEHLARCIHAESPRRAQPFVAVNCAAIPESLFESELFGHERGAFTGAIERRRGLIEQAHAGTLLLDEIGDLRDEAITLFERAVVERRVRGDLDRAEGLLADAEAVARRFGSKVIAASESGCPLFREERPEDVPDVLRWQVGLTA
ncbi:MAG: sigma 54-interacting transcriptional regulator [Candidatus Schekmanbacteria bacterium]|nr:sigma 54-interacting transcriptional regulator [Candidatus Schekmanbacteria bacterium]